MTQDTKIKAVGHTAGPWAYARRSAGAHIQAGEGEVAWLRSYMQVPDGEIEANAHLIAAAPELLSELARMVEHFEAFANDHSMDATTETWGALYCAKAIIRKAEGRAS